MCSSRASSRAWRRTSSRHATSSFRQDDARDYERLGQALGVDADAILRVRQVHGRTVLVVKPNTPIIGLSEADAIVTIDPSRAVSVRVADCVPILIADRQQRVAAAIHAGWRGTCAAVASAAVSAIEDLGIEPADLVAAIGPSVGPCCYQVDDLVRTSFLGMTPDAAAWFVEDGPGHWKLDLLQANADQLESAGIPPLPSPSRITARSTTRRTAFPTVPRDRARAGWSRRSLNEPEFK